MRRAWFGAWYVVGWVATPALDRLAARLTRDT